jgi:nicotinate phosphoribosyltransferase
VVFADEPILEVTAPVIEAQLVETALLNLVQLPTTLASKAARVVLASQGRAVVEFGFRRAQGIDAGMKAARCAYLAGAVATSNVLAALSDNIPANGTMAHSYVLAFPQEIDAFRAFAEVFPRGTTLLLDTYDTLAAAHAAVEVATEMAERGEKLSAVRLDSGDLEGLSRGVRAILDEAGLHDVHIVASGGLDEDDIARLVARGAPIDAFGVGTRIGVSADAPYLDSAYKLVEYDGRPMMKLSTDKISAPGRKQVFRAPDGDTIGLREDPLPDDAEPLLVPVMRGGERSGPHRPLDTARALFRADLERVPASAKRIRDPEPVEPSISAALAELTERAKSEALRRAGVP